MKIKQGKNLTVLLIFAMLLSAFSPSVFAVRAPGLELPVEVDVSGRPPTTDDKYIIILKAEDLNNPMPEGSEDGKFELKMPGNSTRKFPNIEFPSLGTYKYKVYQSRETDRSYGYDNKEYDLIVYVTNAKNGDGLEITVRAYPFGETKKDELIFEPEVPSTGGGGSGPGLIRPRDPDRPRRPEDPEEEIVEEEIPEDIPEEEEEVVEEKIPEDIPEEEEEIVEEEIPEDKPEAMPKTGQVPASLYYGIGALLLGVGIGTRKRNRK